ncbi:MAG TPA: four helix bundle protein [Thermoanaerobaculia bacterium]|jgi:four helix bundle protein
MRDHRALPAFQHAHELVLAVHEAVRQLPGGEAARLGARMEAAAHSATAAVARACAVPGEQLSGQIDEASRRVREVGYYIDIAQRMGYLPLGAAVELLERQTLAGLEVNALLEEEGGVRAPKGSPNAIGLNGKDTADLAAEVLATLSASPGR